MTVPIKTSRRKQFARWLFSSVSILWAVVLTVGCVWYFNASRDVERELAQILALNEPITPSDLEAFYTAPSPEQDGTELWLRALAPFGKPEFKEAADDLPLIGSQYDDPPPSGDDSADRAAVESFLMKHRSALEELHQTAAMGKRARYPTRFDQGMLMDYPHAQALVVAGRTLALEAYAAARRNDSAMVTRSILSLVAVGQSIRDEPTPLSQMVRRSVHQLAYMAIESILPLLRFTDDELVQMQHAFAQIDYDPGLHRMMLGERVLTKNLYDVAGSNSATGRLLWRLVRPQSLRHQLRYMRKQIDAATLDWPEKMRASRAAEDRIRETIENSYWILRVEHLLTGMVIGVHANVNMTAVAGNRMQGVESALAIERFRRRHGAIPETLDQLLPDFLDELPLDRFDGQPLRYRHDESGYILYSVGRNEKDDQGEELKEGFPDDALRIVPRKPDRPIATANGN